MADSTIPNLAAVTVPALTDLFGVRQSGDSRDKKLTVTQLITLLPGGGDVSKVGTPVDNQVGVWTGDGTIEGDSEFLWDGSALTVGFVNAGPQLLNEVATDTNPTIVPTRNDPDTGIGHDAADRFALIAGGVTVAHVLEQTGSPAIVIDPNDAGSGAPELAFGAGADTGWRESANVLTLILGGASKWGWDANLYVSITATGAGLKNEVVSATNPTFVPNRSDLNSGIGQNAVDQVSIIAGGIEIARAVEAAAEQFIISPGALLGTAALPSLAFGDGDTGFRESFADTIKVVLAGVDRWTFTGDRFVGVVGNGPSLQNEASTATNPTMIPALGDVSTGIGGVTGGLNIIVGGVNAMQFDQAASVVTIRAEGKIHGFLGTVSAPGYAFRLNSNTGMYSGGASSDELKFSAGGVQALSLKELNSGVIQAHQANVAITAFATGGQGSATQLDESYNVLSVVATTGDSVKLPPVFDIDSVMYIKNDGASAADVFPASGDDLGAGVDTAISLAAGESASFIATVANATWTPWIVSVGGGGGGDVTKVGTPANNQIGVWTGDGTIEGDSDFRWDGSHLLLPLANDAATPTLAFGDGDTGFYESSDDVLRVSCIGSHRFSFNGLLGGNFISQQGNGPQIRNVASSATIPTLNPRQGDPNTGIGTGADDRLSLIAGGVEGIQIIELSASINVINMFGPVVVTGAIRVTDAAGPQIQNEAATATNPTVVPNRADLDTGVGWSAADELSLVAGGVQIAQAKEASGANQFIIAPGVTQNVPLTPSLAFGDGNTGFFESADNTLKVSTGNAARCFWQANNFFAENTAGWFLFNTAGTSASSPIMGPNRGDNNTGIGHGADDQLDFICGGLNCITIREVGSARQVGFYNTTPVAQQTGVAVSSAGIHAALVSLGLITA